MVSEKIQCSYIKENGEQCGNKKLKENIPEDKREGWKCHQHQPDDEEKEDLSFEELKNELTEKQKAFADYYITTLNATQSAIKAGYSENAARQTGSENLSKPYIGEYIQKRLEEKEDTRIADQDEVLIFLTATMRSDLEILDRFEPVDMKERLKAADKLGKTYAMFVDKQEIEHDINNVSAVEIELIDDEEG